MAILFWTNSDTGSLESVKFDACTSIEHQDTTTITDHPVEEGADISDHARDDPERVTIEGIITNTPHVGNLTEDDDHSVQTLDLSFDSMGDRVNKNITLDVPDPPLEISESGLLQAGVQALGSLIFGGPNRTATVSADPNHRSGHASARVLQSNAQRNRARDAYEKLRGAQSAHELITIQSGMREYFDMLIERLNVPIEAKDGTAVRFQIDLRRLRIAESETVQSPQPAEARGSKSKNFGSQAAKADPNAEKKEELESVLSKPAEALLGP